MSEKIEEEKIGTWLQEKLKQRGLVDSRGRTSQHSSNQPLELIVEVEQNKTSQVLPELQKLPITVHSELVSWGRYIPIVARAEDIPAIQSIPYVVKVLYSMPRAPHIEILSEWMRSPLRAPTPFIEDPLLGEVRISEIEIPHVPSLAEILGKLPISGPLGMLMGPTDLEVDIIPTGETREIIEAPEDNLVTTRVAVLDCGSPIPLHPLRVGRMVEEVSLVPEPPWDLVSHGVWCHTCAFLGSLSTRFGEVRSVADALTSLHVKVLDSTGFGSDSTVLRGMELACSWGAKIVNMSLGGPLQGGVDEDPTCRIIQDTGDEVMWVVAAGNSGPGGWTISSPGAAPKALTVGSYSPKYGDVASFSSRGPNAEYYREHRGEWDKDYARYGENLIKPDILAPGGGPVRDGQRMDLIYSGGQGWADGQYDGTQMDGFSAMRGTSMATPHVAGLLALLHERFGVGSVGEVKEMMRRISGGKSYDRGYGLIRYGIFR